MGFYERLNDLRMEAIEAKEKKDRARAEVQKRLRLLADATKDLDPRILAKWEEEVYTVDGEYCGKRDRYIITGEAAVFSFEARSDFYRTVEDLLAAIEYYGCTKLTKFENATLASLEKILEKLDNL